MRCALALVCLGGGSAFAQPADGGVQPAPTIRAFHVETPVTIDGRLDEEVWSRAPASAAFVQVTPDDGQPPSQPTTFRVLYGPEGLTFGIRCEDAEPAGIVARLTRRDRSSFSDNLTLDLDTRGDHQAAFHFEVDAANVQRDGIRTGDDSIDFAWDAVWLSAVRRDASGWTAEISIPWTALRFPAGASSFRLQVRRGLPRRLETSSWVYIPRDQSGELLRYGELQGLAGLPSPRSLELKPFVVGSLGFDTASADDGSATTTHPGLSVGVDGRLSLDSELGLDFTALPDFGQVEADQVILNLSTFEVNFPEKRPFFLEGADLFALTDAYGNPFSTQLFYSRRLGAPIAEPTLPDGATLKQVPDHTRLLGAAKLTGRIGDHTTVAILDGVDAPEWGTWDDGMGEKSFGLRPPSNVFAARVRTEVADRFELGVGLTNRTWFEEGGRIGLQGLCPSGLSAGAGGRCTTDATAASLDLGWQSKDGGWKAKAILLASLRYGGPEEALRDGTRLTSGAQDLGWIAQLVKDSGNLRFQLLNEVYGPKLELNDTGYLRSQNLFRVFANLNYRLFDHGPARRTELGVEPFIRESFDGADITRGVQIYSSTTWTNGWGTWLEVQWNPVTFDNRETRDGSFTQRAQLWSVDTWWGTNPIQAVSWGQWAFLGTTWAGFDLESGGDFTVRPEGRLEFVLSPSLTLLRGDPRWVDTFDAAPGREYLFGLQDALAVGATLRSTVTLTNSLSFQAYAQLFSADVRYEKLYAVDKPAGHANVLLADLKPSAVDPETYRSQETALNLNLVLRWEYLPGSTLFLVYTRSANGAFPGAWTDGRPRLDLHALGRGPAQDVVLLKATYRFAR